MSVIDSVEQIYGISLTEKFIDHICYRCCNVEEYIGICSEMKKYGNLVVEGMISGRPISTFHLHQPIYFQEKLGLMRAWTIPCIEIPSPKPGRYYASGLEHIEIVIGDEASSPIDCKLYLTNFMTNYPEVQFDVNAIDKHINADISIKLQNNISVKFHMCPLLEVCEYEKRNGLVENVPEDYYLSKSYS